MTKLLHRLRCGLSLLRGRKAASRAAPALVKDSLDLAMERAGTSFRQWLPTSEARLYVCVDKERLDHLKHYHHAETTATLTAANEVLDHRFNLLGSGPFVPVDDSRESGPDGYRPIDWYIDPVRGLRFPRGMHHTEWNLQKMRPGNADIKYPWELSRCQHWPLLAQAWMLTGDLRYALEIRNELDDFMAANPVGTGINWTCTMDVALRALNWAVGLQMVRGCPCLDEVFWHRAYGHLYNHAGFIFANLEDKYEVTSNHFLSNVVGLYYLASVFRELDTGRLWKDFCRQSIERELKVQVLEDGADYESSVPYHRLVTELFLGAARLADWGGEPFSRAYRDKLHKMVHFLAGVLRPDGLMPQIGDADDGRLHILSDYGTWKPQDARHIFAPASLVLNEPRWRVHCGPAGAWEAAWWGFDIRAERLFDGSPADTAMLYPEAGIAIARRRGTYLAVTNGLVGTKGFGNHKHNDQLGFEFHADGEPLIVDPGTFVYTSDPDARNLFRGTGYHNTVMVDGIEQNDLRPEWLFRLFETAHATHVSFIVEDGIVRYCGRHSGYSRLTLPVEHERTFRVFLESGALSIVDRFEGRGNHKFIWHFHLAPEVAVTEKLLPRVLLVRAARNYVLEGPAGLEVSASPAWYSPSYGVRQRCVALQWQGRFDIDGERLFEFSLHPAQQAAGALS